MKPYDTQLKKLIGVSKIFSIRVSEAEARLSAFRKLTSDVIERISQVGKSHCLHYIKLWFRAFLGTRDECMLLITGEIVRGYHIDSNKDSLHDRNRESHYYNDSCSLTMCSTDGLDFEYRKLVDKYGHRDAFDKLAEASEVGSNRLHALFKAINACHDQLESFLKSQKYCKYTSEIKHCTESIEFVYKVGEEKKKAMLSNQTYRKCSRAQALATIIEDPPDVNILPSVAAKPTDSSSMTMNKRSKRRLDLEDSDEEIDSTPALLPTQQNKTFDLDFQFTASLDEIKKAYNPPTLPLSTSGSTALLADKEQKSIHLPYSVGEYAGLSQPETITLKFKVINPHLPLSQLDIDSGHISLTLPVQSIANLVESKLKGKMTHELVTSSLLEEIMKLLWYGPLSYVADNENNSTRRWGVQIELGALFSLWIPKAVQIEGVKYQKGSKITLPDLSKPKKFPVLCENDSTTLALSEAIQYWITHHEGNVVKDRSVILQRQQLVYEHKDYVFFFSKFLRKKLQDPQQIISFSGNQTLCFCCHSLDSEIKKVCHSFKLSLWKHTSALYSSLQAKVSCHVLGADDFFFMSKYCDMITISSPCLHLPSLHSHLQYLSVYINNHYANILDYQWRLESLILDDIKLFSYVDPLASHDSRKELSSLLQETCRVDLSNMSCFSDTNLEVIFDSLIEALEDKVWRDPWSEVLDKLCSHSPSLTSLTFLACSLSTLEQFVLMAGIAQAMAKRQEIVQLDTVYKIVCDMNEEDTDKKKVLQIAGEKLSALSSSAAFAHAMTITIQERTITIPSFIDLCR